MNRRNERNAADCASYPHTQWLRKMQHFKSYYGCFRNIDFGIIFLSSSASYRRFVSLRALFGVSYAYVWDFNICSANASGFFRVRRMPEIDICMHITKIVMIIDFQSAQLETHSHACARTPTTGADKPAHIPIPNMHRSIPSLWENMCNTPRNWIFVLLFYFSYTFRVWFSNEWRPFFAWLASWAVVFVFIFISTVFVVVAVQLLFHTLSNYTYFNYPLSLEMSLPSSFTYALLLAVRWRWCQ